MKHNVGGARLRGELRFHANLLGTAPVLGLTFPLRLLCKSSPLKCLEQTRVSSFIKKFGPTSSPYSMNALPFEVFFLWEAKKRNFFTRLLVPLVLLRTERHTAICGHLSAFLRWKSLVHSRISRLVTKKTIFCLYPPKMATISTIFYEKFVTKPKVCILWPTKPHIHAFETRPFRAATIYKYGVYMKSKQRNGPGSQ